MTETLERDAVAAMTNGRAALDAMDRGESVAAPRTWSRAKRWDPASIIAAFRRFAEEHGRPPSQADLRGNRALPPATVVSRNFGSWANGMEAAGFPRPRRGSRASSGGSSTERAAATETPAADAGSTPAPRSEDDAREVEGVSAGFAEGIEIEVDAPLPEHGRHLVESLGATVKVRGEKPAAQVLPVVPERTRSVPELPGGVAVLSVAADDLALTARDVDYAVAAYKGAKADLKDSLQRFVSGLDELRNLAAEALKV